ncbi:MAG: hypothetical protein KIS92_01575 [Planctomycetota bacterium]|nr:hypothetical protein [Planctomycetota bacterium]
MNGTRGRLLALVMLAAILAGTAHGVEERIRGVLEKTARPDACAQIKDALNETYYISKSEPAEKMIAELMGKRVLITGIVEQHPGDPAYYFVLKKAEPYAAKLPAAPKTTDGKTESPLPLPPLESKPLPLPLPKEEKPAAAPDEAKKTAKTEAKSELEKAEKK